MKPLLDYQWQLEWETLGNTGHMENLMPREDHSGTDGGRQQYFLAWSTECVLQSIDKLEVRGRDSAGIAIAFTLKPGSVPEDILDPESLPEFRRRSNIRNAAPGSVLCRQTRDGRYYIRFVYKVSNLVGQLGDNGRELRRAIHDDDLMWNLGRNLDRLSIIAHTRWASNGVINIPNCHPVNGDLISGPSDEDYQVTDDPGREALFILNGDVDNYTDLVRETVLPQGLRIHPTISTDAKILPVLFLVDTPGRDSTEERFRRVIQRCEGSMAICMQHPEHISSLFMAQKGSGQSLYVTPDQGRLFRGVRSVRRGRLQPLVLSPGFERGRRGHGGLIRPGNTFDILYRRKRTVRAQEGADRNLFPRYFPQRI